MGVGLLDAVRLVVVDRRRHADVERRPDLPVEVLVGAGGVEQDRERIILVALSDLDLFLWNRLPVSALDVVGDAAVAERWGEVVKT